MNLLNSGSSCSVCGASYKSFWGLRGCISTSELTLLTSSTSTIGILDIGEGEGDENLKEKRKKKENYYK